MGEEKLLTVTYYFHKEDGKKPSDFWECIHETSWTIPQQKCQVSLTKMLATLVNNNIGFA